ncbi:bifunctional diaminohydroxyphosphoribosylaminopyrimidine deaminase/5-amino-6-(5-phosphoribosylamino)uracil reductase RibD [Yoonia sp.]|uniref:bifunctional diaminohydroxyphosphoribosylaminopyrimidine deaminase/5-amino-6-(5-phosphoribosylamino)uracil reductase RibD n=1 Tax=Yoonia sp. TaxID=2212373 RepID=UPI0025E41090|nr:bifunctional diaminohydroxyphosphoribosylaminopyrimidine deaminase/5-amino-6-(5-phosphoribosylamino)uracil reductase RibD [Yoonia sp.]
MDARFMALALSLGRRGMGRVWPNPAVGCVIVRDGRIVGRGNTADGGRPHAEPVALAQAGQQARGATAYVSLEPCAHHGQTPPCANALISAGVARVVIASTDPDPRVAGRGIAMLRAAGICVDTGVLEQQARLDHAGFFLRIGENRPYVTLKLAGTLDGRIATASGESQWITGPEARRAVHLMRARHDAVMVGAGTVRADDPALTVRGMGVFRQPVRVVVSRAMKIPSTAQLARTARDVPVWLCHGAKADVTDWTEKGAVSLRCDVRAGQVDPASAMAALAARGVTRVFCEGGGMLAASLLSADLVDALVVFSAGRVIGAEGTPALAAMGVDKLDAAPRFKLDQVQRVGGDIMHRWLRA